MPSTTMIADAPSQETGVGPENLTGRSPRVRYACALAAWCALVLALFAVEHRALFGLAIARTVTLAWAVICGYAIWFTGFRLLRRAIGAGTDAISSGCERTAYELGLGALIAMLSVTALGFLGALRPVVAYGLLGVLLAGNHLAFWRDLRGRWTGRSNPRPSDRYFLALTLVGGALALVSGLAPPVSQDALVYHLAIPARYIDAGGIVPVPGNFFAQFPQYVELLFTWALLLDGPELAKLVHWGFGVASSIALAGLVRALDPRASRSLAVALFATLPTVMLVAGWAYVDLAIVHFSLLTLLCLLRWFEFDTIRWGVLGAIFAGAAAGTKYTGGLNGLIVVGAAIAIARSRSYSGRSFLRTVFILAGVVALVAAPWWLKNIAYTGNPLYPFAFGLFGGEGWDAERQAILSGSLREWGGDRGIFATIALPWRVTMDGRFFDPVHFDGVIGAGFLLAVPALALTLRRGSGCGIVWTFVAVHVLLWILTTRQVRFLLPALAVLSALTACGIQRMQTGDRLLRGAVVAAVALNVGMALFHFAGHRPLGVVLGLESRDAYLEREVPGGDYSMFRFIADELPEDAYLLFGSLGNPGFLCERRYYADAFIENHTLKELLTRGATPSGVAGEFRARGFTHFVFRFDCVFDATRRKSDLTLAQQQLLATFLNRYGSELYRKAGTLLYAVDSSADAARESG